MFELVCQLVSDQNGCLLLETRLMASETKKVVGHEIKTSWQS